MADAGSRELQSPLHERHLAEEFSHARGREAESRVPAAAEGKRSGNGTDSVFFSSSKEAVSCLQRDGAAGSKRRPRKRLE